ncbi:MAG: septum site-determining protein MinC [Anaerolineaceae bacterium]|nr:septum site-determining protein MinC [Anaerolineaceae bacterium]
MNIPALQIKGIKDGILVTVRTDEWDDVFSALQQKIGEQEAFFQGAKLALDIGDLLVTASQLGRMRDVLSEKGITLWALLSTMERSIDNAKSLGIGISLPRPSAGINRKTEPIIPDGELAVFLNKTLRSGYRISYAGHVVVLGDVNPGAEIIATGNVLIWGKLRGTVHAGAMGNAEACVCAMDLNPTQLRIADYITIPPKRKGKPQPEIAKVDGEQIIAKPWKA